MSLRFDMINNMNGYRKIISIYNIWHTNYTVSVLDAAFFSPWALSCLCKHAPANR